MHLKCGLCLELATRMIRDQVYCLDCYNILTNGSSIGYWSLDHEGKPKSFIEKGIKSCEVIYKDFSKRKKAV